MSETKLTTPEEAIDFFVKLTEAVLTEADRETLRAQAAQMVDGFQSLAVAFRLWSEAPGSRCPNHLTQTFLVSKADGSDDGCVEIVLRRVRPGGESFAALAADAVRAKAIRAAGAEWRAALVDAEEAVVESESEETIATAAIRVDGEVWTLPRPARHDTPIKAWQWAHQREIGEHEHGFVTSKGRFVDRVEGARVAHAAGQIPRDNGFLTSEDLW